MVTLSTCSTTMHCDSTLILPPPFRNNTSTQQPTKTPLTSSHSQAMIRQKAHAVANRMFENMRPIQRYDGTTAPSTVPTTVSRVKAHTRQLSNSLLSGNKNAGYEALANGSTTTMRGGAEGESPFELRELLKGKGGSVETTTAGCEVEEVDGKTFGHTK